MKDSIMVFILVVSFIGCKIPDDKPSKLEKELIGYWTLYQIEKKDTGERISVDKNEQRLYRKIGRRPHPSTGEYWDDSLFIYKRGLLTESYGTNHIVGSINKDTFVYGLRNGQSISFKIFENNDNQTCIKVNGPAFPPAIMNIESDNDSYFYVKE